MPWRNDVLTDILLVERLVFKENGTEEHRGHQKNAPRAGVRGDIPLKVIFSWEERRCKIAINF